MPEGVLVGITSRVPNGHYTISQAAVRVGRSVSVLRRYALTGIFEPSEAMKAGKLEVALYTEDDIRDLQAFLRGQHKGRPSSGEMRAIGRVQVVDLAKGDIISDPREEHQTEYAMVVHNYDDAKIPRRRYLVLTALGDERKTEFGIHTWRGQKYMVFVPHS